MSAHLLCLPCHSEGATRDAAIEARHRAEEENRQPPARLDNNKTRKPDFLCDVSHIPWRRSMAISFCKAGTLARF
jgi:hypothetical protein